MEIIAVHLDNNPKFIFICHPQSNLTVTDMSDRLTLSQLYSPLQGPSNEQNKFPKLNYLHQKSLYEIDIKFGSV